MSGDSISYSQATTDAKPPLSLPSPEASPPEAQYTSHSHSFEFSPPIPATARAVDLDGMSMMPISLRTSSTNDSALDLSLGFDDVTNGPNHEGALIQAPDSPATAAFAPYIQEIEMFGRAWNCPSPITLHIPESTSAASNANMPICPIWRRSNELFNKIYSSRLPPSTGVSNISLGNAFEWGLEAGLLFKGIKDGWKTFDNWKQSPVLQILKAVDQFLFVKSAKMERLAASYKSFKLLKVSLRQNLARLYHPDTQYGTNPDTVPLQ
ncbi:hypothetical protein SLS60_001327 [Paraconiothyrium brasiliense]|uniref:Uncharacterized protein n=1 Tax=Paraconiothyrium brasiliense TaxID=300254 RepID=A0ABR3S8Y0_9PLEO